MKSFKYIIFQVLFIALACGVQAQKTIVVGRNNGVIDGSAAPYNVIQPGDTVALSSGNWDFIIIKNFKGSLLKPIIFINKGGQVNVESDHYYGISIQKSIYVKLTGTGSKTLNYGIRIAMNQGGALGIGYGSSDYEIERVEIARSAGPGILAKTDPDCSGTYNRFNFIQYNTVIHDCYVHDTDTEGMYIGNVFYKGYKTKCDGKDTTLYPHLLVGVSVYNNKVERTGWDGIQVSSASNIDIYNNQIKYDSQTKTEQQMSGIIIGEGSAGKVHDNNIQSGEGTGVMCFALGPISLYNNIILNPGFSGTGTAANQFGMYFNDREAVNSNKFFVLNNLILHPRKEGIRYTSTRKDTVSTIANNIIINSDIYSSVGDKAYVVLAGCDVTVKKNYGAISSRYADFQDTLAGNYNLKQSSPLIDAGYASFAYNIPSDYAGKSRVSGPTIDIGPYEYQYVINGIKPINRHATLGYCYPNPSSGDMVVTYQVASPNSAVDILVMDTNGQERKRITTNQVQSHGTYQLQVSTTDWPSGLYYIVFRIGLERDIYKFIKN